MVRYHFFVVTFDRFALNNLVLDKIQEIALHWPRNSALLTECWYN